VQVAVELEIRDAFGQSAEVAGVLPSDDRFLYHLTKRAFDVLVAASALVVLAPLMLVLAALVRLSSPGPILFRQRRVGKDGREFEMLKFRTMMACRRRGERRSSEAAAGDDRRAADRRRAHKTRRDPRVTTIGRVLRRTSLDELPQLLNILKGEMSLVGPRPELPTIVARYESWQHARHAVTPGLTGWWQVNRDGTRLMHEATEYDLHYVSHQSWRLDLVILVRTVKAVLTGAGAF
jgi:lipopolysaccharide/colanic/teichoic acid biosynthesis glycosyltransferase